MDPKKVSRADRKNVDLTHISNGCFAAKFIKICDRLDNVKDYLDCPDQFRRHRYAKETDKLLRVLMDVDDDLWMRVVNANRELMES